MHQHQGRKHHSRQAWLPGWQAESSHLDLKAGSRQIKLGVNGGLSISEPSPGEAHPPARPYPLSFTRQCHHLSVQMLETVGNILFNIISWFLCPPEIRCCSRTHQKTNFSLTPNEFPLNSYCRIHWSQGNQRHPTPGRFKHPAFRVCF